MKYVIPYNLMYLLELDTLVKFLVFTLKLKDTTYTQK